MSRLGLLAVGRVIVIASVFLCLLGRTEPAFAQKEKRIALVISNSGYQHATRLSNPYNDAVAVSEKFKAAGYNVDLRHDLSNIEMRRALREFTLASRSADTAVFYFAGHGFEVSGTNYLIPVDAKLQTDLDVEDEALSLERIVKSLEPAKKLRLIILDACRDNPFLKNMARTSATRSVSTGLARIESDDTLIAFAAKAGSTADDGDVGNSPFTTALLKHLFEPSVDVRIALGKVRDEVKRATDNRQEPFIYGSLGGTTVSLVPGVEPRQQVAAPASNDPEAIMRRDYEFAAQIGTREAWESFLQVYKTGIVAGLAKAALSKVVAAEKAEAVAAEQKAKAEAAEKSRASNAASERAKADAATAAAQAAERDRAAAVEKARLDAERRQQAAAAEEARRASPAQEARPKTAPAGQQVAALDREADGTRALSVESNNLEITRSLQTELSRVGCHLGAIDGEWNPASQSSFDSFVRYAGVKLDTDIALSDALDLVRGKKSRVCPLLCEQGFRADKGRCVAVKPARAKPEAPVREKASKPAAARVRHAAPEPRRSRRNAGGGDGGWRSSIQQRPTSSMPEASPWSRMAR